MAKKNERFCECCREPLAAERIRLCESCQAAGLGQNIKTRAVDGRELLAVARAREGKIPPLHGMGLDGIAAIARLFRAPYNTYGKLRGFVAMTGRMPGVEFERRDGE